MQKQNVAPLTFEPGRKAAHVVWRNGRAQDNGRSVPQSCTEGTEGKSDFLSARVDSSNDSASVRRRPGQSRFGNGGRNLFVTRLGSATLSNTGLKTLSWAVQYLTLLRDDSKIQVDDAEVGTVQ